MLPDHTYAKRSLTETISDYERLCKRFKITSLDLETSIEVDPCSETLLVREETPISISVSSSVSRSEYFYSQYFSCRNCLASVWRSQERLLRSQTLLQIRRPLFWYIAHLRSKLSSRSGVKNFRESPRTGTPSGISSRDSQRNIRSWVGLLLSYIVRLQKILVQTCLANLFLV